MKKLLLLMCVAIISLPAGAATTSDDDLKQRVADLDELSLMAAESYKDLANDLAHRMTVSGYADAEYSTSTQDGYHPGFRLHHLSLFFKKQISDKWRFFSEIEYEDAPFMEWGFNPTAAPNACDHDCNGAVFVEAVNIDYLWRPELSLRAGRFFTPAGIWSIDHYPPFVPTQVVPMFIGQVFPRVFDGGLAYGIHKVGNTFLSYDVYAGNGENNPGSGDQNSTTAYGVKLNLALPVLKQFDIGTTYYSDGKLTPFEGMYDGDKKTAYGFHAKLRFNRFTVQSEYGKAKFEPLTAASYDNEGYYAQFLYDISNWLVGYRYDYYDPDTAVTTNSTVDNAVFVNYRATKDVVLKLEHHQVDEKDPALEDYAKDIASVVVNLGN